MEIVDGKGEDHTGDVMNSLSTTSAGNEWISNPLHRADSTFSNNEDIMKSPSPTSHVGGTFHRHRHHTAPNLKIEVYLNRSRVLNGQPLEGHLKCSCYARVEATNAISLQSLSLDLIGEVVVHQRRPRNIKTTTFLLHPIQHIQSMAGPPFEAIAIGHQPDAELFWKLERKVTVISWRLDAVPWVDVPCSTVLDQGEVRYRIQA